MFRLRMAEGLRGVAWDVLQAVVACGPAAPRMRTTMRERRVVLFSLFSAPSREHSVPTAGVGGEGRLTQER